MWKTCGMLPYELTYQMTLSSKHMSKIGLLAKIYPSVGRGGKGRSVSVNPNTSI